MEVFTPETGYLVYLFETGGLTKLLFNWLSYQNIFLLKLITRVNSANICCIFCFYFAGNDKLGLWGLPLIIDRSRGCCVPEHWEQPICNFSVIVAFNPCFNYHLILLMIRVNFLPIAIIICTISAAWAQNPNKITIKGKLVDTTGSEIVLPTVMLLNPADSTLINFTRGDEQGAFVFKNVPNKPYLLKATFIGYIPLQMYMPASGSDEVDLGNLGMKMLNEQLMEVVVRTAKSTLSIRGDTVEYDASSFKVPPGSTVEDLLRRLPGIELDADGNIKAQGRDVNRVYVDGKTFFGDDPKAATKNLGAETISKVQVYDEASEQSKLTGVDDGKEEKVMNLELKDEFKKGSFGKITGAVGTEERWAARGNYNRFNEKQQLSFIGFGNNINETGVNWEDYGEFKGQNAFNNYDNGDFGFDNGGRYWYSSGGDDSPLNNFDGRGFTENYGGGVNYNFDNKKTKFNANYFYNQTDLTFREYATRENFLEEGTFSNDDTTRQDEFRNRHSVATRIEQEIDSSNTIIAKANLSIRKNDREQQLSQYFTDNLDDPINRLLSVNESLIDVVDLTSAAIYRHRFQKKGRSFAMSAGFNQSISDGMENLRFQNLFFETENQSNTFEQNADTKNDTRQIKSSLLFTEPLSKKWFWESFYNFSQTNNQTDRQVSDPLNGDARIDSLSIFYDNDVLYNRLGTVIRYAYEGLNVGVGLAGQQLDLDGDYARGEGEAALSDPIRLQFFNMIPHLSINYDFTNNFSGDFEYSYSVQEPGFRDLQPVAIITNPLYVRQGNPNLEPERANSISLGLYYWNPATFANFGISTNYNDYDNQIVYNQTIELIDSVGLRTTTTPGNADGGSQYNVWMWSSFPIVKTKLTMNLNGGVDGNVSPAFVNDVKNETRSNSIEMGVRFNYTPSSKLVFNAAYRLGFDDIRYSIQTNQNQKIYNNNANAGIKWEFIPKTFVESNFNYNANRNDQTGFEQNVPLWNTSVRRLFGPKNKIEARIAAFDLLNRRVNVTQRATQNYVVTTVTETLAQYFMLSVSYNVRGFENNLKKGGGFW